MNITSTGNNFGAGEITLNTFQNEKLVVLNGKFSFNNKSDAFAAASVLEVYVPELSIPKSGMSGAYIIFEAEGKFYGTTVKTWIKNSKTVCIEKLDYWPEQTDEYTIYLLSLYVTEGSSPFVTEPISMLPAGPVAPTISGIGSLHSALGSAVFRSLCQR